MATETDDAEIAGTPRKKHRHDLGHEDHGSKLAAGTTRTIQIVLGMWILATGILVVWALVDASHTGSDILAPPRKPAVTEPAQR
jgi:hypothetical protein